MQYIETVKYQTAKHWIKSNDLNKKVKSLDGKVVRFLITVHRHFVIWITSPNRLHGQWMYKTNRSQFCMCFFVNLPA